MCWVLFLARFPYFIFHLHNFSSHLSPQAEGFISARKSLCRGLLLAELSGEGGHPPPEGPPGGKEAIEERLQQYTEVPRPYTQDPRHRLLQVSESYTSH